MTKLWRKVKREPVAVKSAFVGLILVILGLNHVDGGLVAAIGTCLEALLVLPVRSAVTPTQGE